MNLRFDYVEFGKKQMEDQLAIKNVCTQLEKLIEDLGDSRHTSLALTKLEECYMWVGKELKDRSLDVKNEE